jgi:hypothetical protein
LSVVVVFATPPFWLANAITSRLAVTGAPPKKSFDLREAFAA